MSGIRQRLATLALAFLLSASAFASEDEEIVFPVQRGQTLQQIADARLEPGRDWRDLARYNDFTRPDRLRPGQAVRIPWHWLKLHAVDARLLGRDGETRIDSQRPAVLGEGDRIHTGANGTVDIQLPDGTMLRIPPASDVQIERLRQYYRSESVDARLRIEQGRIEVRSSQAQQSKAHRRIEIHAPKAIAAVRGTVFRVGDTPEHSVSEVLQGEVQWRSDSAELQVGAGYGSSARPDGSLSKPVPLPPPPNLGKLPARFTVARFELSFGAEPRATKYRVQIREDRPDGPILADRLISEPRISLDSRHDGPHYVRVRSVLDNGIEGEDAVHAFKVEARPFAPQAVQPNAGAVIYEPQLVIGWTPSVGAQAYRLQLARDDDFSKPVLDMHTTSTQWRLELPAEPNASSTGFAWRVAAMDEQGQGPFSATTHFERRDLPRTPHLGNTLLLGSMPGKERMIRWIGGDAIAFELEVAGDRSFAAPLLSRRLTQAQFELPPLAPGIYHLRIRSIDGNGMKSPFSVPSSFAVAPRIQSSDGDAIQAGYGPLLGTPF